MIKHWRNDGNAWKMGAHITLHLRQFELSNRYHILFSQMTKHSTPFYASITYVFYILKQPPPKCYGFNSIQSMGDRFLGANKTKKKNIERYSVTIALI